MKRFLNRHETVKMCPNKKLWLLILGVLIGSEQNPKGNCLGHCAPLVRSNQHLCRFICGRENGNCFFWVACSSLTKRLLSVCCNWGCCALFLMFFFNEIIMCNYLADCANLLHVFCYFVEFVVVIFALFVLAWQKNVLIAPRCPNRGTCPYTISK